MHMKSKYDEIMGRPHHVSKTRPQMPMSDRAAQFAPFAALTGYDAAIKETGRLTDDKIELDEEALTALDMKYQLLMDALDDALPNSSPMSGRLAANTPRQPARSKRWMILSGESPCRTARRFRWMTF